MVERGSMEGVTMKRIVMFLLGSTFAMVLVSAAIGQTTDPAGAGKDAATPSPSSPAPETTAPAPATTPAPDAAQPAPAPAQVEATPAPKSTPAMDHMKDLGMKASAKERADVDKSIDDIEKGIEKETTAKGDAEVSGRIASEFGMTPDALTAERSQYGRGWGELLIAHTLLSNAKTDATLSDFFGMRSQGMGWGVIAAGLGLKLGEVIPAMKSEGRVAMGLEKGDGKPAVIHMMGAASASKTKVATKVPGAKGSVKAGASAAGAGVGGGVDLNKGVGK
jgi:hypothetical protein